MLTAEQGKEIVVRTISEIGILARIAKIVAEKGVSILAVSGWVVGSDGLIHLVTDDNLRAADALRKAKFEVREGKVVLVEMPHKPGMLKHLTERLAKAGVDIHHIYASAHSADSTCLLVFSSSDNDRAIVAINK